MKIILKQVLIFLFLSGSITSFSQQHRIRFVELNGEYFGNIDQYGLGANVTVGKEYFGAVLAYNYRKVDLSFIAPDLNPVSISELYMGARYYPMRPTFMFGKMALRLTAGAMYGFDMEPNWRALLFAGFAISPVTSTSGVSVNFVYRPGSFPASGYLLEPSWMIRLGIIIGPSFNQ